ncbi:MAG TPA: PsiF family protein [Steroidobacteraceae bacterium]|nr:PsiF family protein [Steroidobacteraceae bacterium]
MKMLHTLAIGALLTTGAAFAATSPASPAASTSTAPTATPAASVQPVSAQPAEKHPSTMHCEKEAKAKKLIGDAEKTFVKDCRDKKS